MSKQTSFNYWLFLALAGAICIVSITIVSGCTSNNQPNTPTPATSSVTAYNASDDNRTVALKNGDSIIVSLDENPSTGYSWNVSATSGLSIRDLGYVDKGTQGMVGAGGMHSWAITATGTGDQAFSGIYKRPWEPVYGNETTYLLHITPV